MLVFPFLADSDTVTLSHETTEILVPLSHGWGCPPVVTKGTSLKKKGCTDCQRRRKQGIQLHDHNDVVKNVIK